MKINAFCDATRRSPSRSSPTFRRITCLYYSSTMKTYEVHSCEMGTLTGACRVTFHKIVLFRLLLLLLLLVGWD
jgi:hypothetical protein